MGERSFGKGSVQSVLPLGDGRAVKLTTARYFTPNGRSIQAEGIAPDIVIEPAEIRPYNISNRVREENLDGHLESDGTLTDNSKESEKEQIPSIDDNQLYEALNLLKGFQLLGQRATLD